MAMLDPDIFIAFNYEKRQLDMDPLENTLMNNCFFVFARHHE